MSVSGQGHFGRTCAYQFQTFGDAICHAVAFRVTKTRGISQLIMKGCPYRSPGGVISGELVRSSIGPLVTRFATLARLG